MPQMASVTKRVNKAGNVSYLIRVFLEQGSDGKQATKSITWTPPAGMRPTAADKQAEKEAVLFEEKVRSGVVSINGKTSFADYAAQWMDAVELAPKTREQYVYLLRRINQAIGHIPLEKLRVEHLQKFIKNLREEGVKDIGGFATSATVDEYRKSIGLTQRKLSERSGVSVTTIAAAAHGRHVSIETAKKLCKVLGQALEKVFTVEGGSEKLSDRTVRHHHKLIHSILESAKNLA